MIHVPDTIARDLQLFDLGELSAEAETQFLQELVDSMQAWMLGAFYQEIVEELIHVGDLIENPYYPSSDWDLRLDLFLDFDRLDDRRWYYEVESSDDMGIMTVTIKQRRHRIFEVTVNIWEPDQKAYTFSIPSLEMAEKVGTRIILDHIQEHTLWGVLHEDSRSPLAYSFRHLPVR